MNILIAEDNKDIANFIYTVIKNHHTDWNLSIAYTYSDALDIATTDNFDLFILDYALKENDLNSSENGLNLGLSIKAMKKYENTPVVFETSFQEHLLDVVNQLNCVYYILKPFTENDLEHMLQKVIHAVPEKKYIVLKDSNCIGYKLLTDDILYVQSRNHKLIVATLDGTLIAVRNNLSLLEQDNIVRCHKSYIVNLKYIYAIDTRNKMITLQNPVTHKKHSIPIGRTYFTTITERINEINDTCTFSSI